MVGNLGVYKINQAHQGNRISWHEEVYTKKKISYMSLIVLHSSQNEFLLCFLE